jgi:uncharacterized membrane protein
MKISVRVVALVLAVPGVFGMIQQQDSAPKEQNAASRPVSFKNDVAPVIKKYCLPCHDDENNNPSELSLDTYELLMKGGKHRVPVVAGKSAESILVQKLSSTPPFGDPMPLTRRKKNSGPPKKLTEEELKLVEDWIDQGAKNN